MLTAGMLGVDFQRPIRGFGNPLFPDFVTIKTSIL